MRPNINSGDTYVWDPSTCSLLTRSCGIANCCATSTAASAGPKYGLKPTLGNTVCLHIPCKPWKLTLTGFFCHQSHWQQHGMAPTPHTSTACPNGPTDYHARLLPPSHLPPSTLTPSVKPCKLGLFCLYCCGNNTAWHPHPTHPQRAPIAQPTTTPTYTHPQALCNPL